MSKHTTGPWEISGGALRIFSAKTNEPVAFALGCTPEDGLSPTPEKAVANARLIAAAPDLLAALSDLLAIEGIQGDRGVVISKACAAIAKARGEA